MGLFDYVVVSGPEFVCSEGHDLTNEEFQSKDFGCTMGSVSISRRGVDLQPRFGGSGEAPQHPLHGVFEIYSACPTCPTFVQAKTGNLVDVDCVFEVKITDGAVIKIQRISQTTAEFLDSTPKQPWMTDCIGPISREEAERVRIRIWDERRKAQERERQNAKPPR